ncbi:SAVED domain-containing protein [Paenibacillus sp. LS1]|uniref:SAVED domain-containing protein n=1 Tax=Paenibacillus sp. LS1 TaxID=2992120 RepID=UPI00222ED7AC|nr:SAVED domain-containing protein [Paenibacillus sp. LS1]MCW3794469.1 SAVED domain-containing protein [Paenibacillus sp. LS1]
MSEDRKNSRRTLVSAERNHLWMVSGGICTFEGCSERLVAETDGKLTNVGQAAHIIGHSKGGPRHEYAEEFGFTDESLEDVKNLMLMCYKHAKLIDDKHSKDSYSPKVLFDMKSKHEARVRSWTDEKKKSLAIVHKRLGPPLTTLPITTNSSNIILEAIEDQTVFDDPSVEGWEQGRHANEQIYRKFMDLTQIGEYDVAEVYPLSPIPLLIHLGKLLSDTIPLTVYQYDRESAFWVSGVPEGETLEKIDPKATFTNNDSNELVVTIAVSSAIFDEDIEEVLGKDKDRLEITIDNPHLKRLIYREQVLEVQKLFKNETEKLFGQKRYNRIHLFYSGPAGLAIELGRSIHHSMWPQVSLYNFNYKETPRYQHAFVI